MGEEKQMVTETKATFRPIDGDTAPDHFQILAAFDLAPEDISETPPARAKLFMSPEFTNPEGADADRGKTRHYAVIIEYPDPLEDTAVRMDDCSTARGSRIFRKFVEGVADDKGYTLERVPTDELL